VIAARWLGVERRELSRCASTNDEAEAWARDGAPHGAVVIAREQTAGRGRGGHRWHSPDGDNVYLSCVLRPALAPHDVPPVTLAAGVGVCDAVNSWGVRASLKWPNDVLVMNRKIAGILTEMSTRGKTLEHLILGVGVNLNGASFPPDIEPIAISLRTALGGRRVDCAAFTSTLLARLERWLDRFFAGGVGAISAPWTERASIAGRRIQTDAATGIARGIDAGGALLVQDDRGTVHRVVAGDVTVLR